MNALLSLLRKQLEQIISNIDSGNSNLSDSELIDALNYIGKITNTKRLSKYSAYTYLGVSRATFDNYIREGKLPKGIKESGFKELSWDRSVLDDFIRKNNK